MKQDGFTLIELIIALVISGILTAMSIPIAYNYIQSQKAIKTVREMKSIAQAENLYYQSNTVPMTCSVTVSGTNYNETENYHIYTSSFSNLTNMGMFGVLSSGVNPFGQDYYLEPVYSNISVNSNNYCVRESGILVYTYIPIQYKGAVSLIAGAFDMGANGSNMEEVGYYLTPNENNSEQDFVLKYNW
jgi:prepilin-type N-terminal cleavage/methylation domain-containing protein